MTSGLAAPDVFRQGNVTRLATWLRRTSASLLRSIRRKDRAFVALTTLSPREKALLRQFLEEDTRTIYVPTPDGALSLEHAEILSIKRVPERAASGAAFALGIHAWAWERLSRHPELLGTTLGQAS